MSHINNLWFHILKTELPDESSFNVNSISKIDWNESKIHSLFWFELDIIAKQRHAQSISSFWFEMETIDEIMNEFKIVLEIKKSCVGIIGYMTNHDVVEYEKFIHEVEKKLKTLI